MLNIFFDNQSLCVSNFPLLNLSWGFRNTYQDKIFIIEVFPLLFNLRAYININISTDHVKCIFAQQQSQKYRRIFSRRMK